MAQATATAVNGTRLTFPRITVSNLGTRNGRGTVVQIPLPAFTTVESISGGGLYCTGTATLSCELWTFAPGSTYTIDITLNTTGTGTLTSNVTVQSGNDSTAGNNSGPVQLSVTAPQSGGGGTGGGGTGGGARAVLGAAAVGSNGWRS